MKYDTEIKQAILIGKLVEVERVHQLPALGPAGCGGALGTLYCSYS